MKPGRKPTVSTDELKNTLMLHKEEILSSNLLIRPTNDTWNKLIDKYQWKITPKALWTRIYKLSPNFDAFFESGLKQNYIIPNYKEDDSISIDSEICISDHTDYFNEDSISILTIFITSLQWKEMQRDDGVKNKLKPGVWTNILSDIIYKTHSINCAWSFKSHEVFSTEASEYFLTFTASCSDDICRTQMVGEVLRHNNLPNPLEHGLTITLNLKGNYNVSHSKKKTIWWKPKKRSFQISFRYSNNINSIQKRPSQLIL